LLYIIGWPKTQDPPTSASLVLGLQMAPSATTVEMPI
jgi:hypothetical protein